MPPQPKPASVAQDVIVSFDFTLTVDGQVIDMTDESEPMNTLIGHNNIISGLEKELMGMKIGEHKTVIVAPEEGYGLSNPDSIVHLQRNEFPEELDLQIGLELAMKTEQGDTVYAVVAGMTNTLVKLDFNHPLAGKELHFDIKITNLRFPTEEELAHGHVH